MRENAMELSATQMALIFAGCVLTIGVVVIVWRRGLLGPKPEASAPVADATPAATNEAAK
jgi:hypothetical protein